MLISWTLHTVSYRFVCVCVNDLQWQSHAEQPRDVLGTSLMFGTFWNCFDTPLRNPMCWWCVHFLIQVHPLSEREGGRERHLAECCRLLRRLLQLLEQLRWSLEDMEPAASFDFGSFHDGFWEDGRPDTERDLRFSVSVTRATECIDDGRLQCIQWLVQSRVDPD